MRKSRIKFTDVDETVLEAIANRPESFFDDLEELSIKVPSWSKLLLVVLAPNKKAMEVGFFEEAKEFFLSYTKKVLRYTTSNLNFICFSREQSDDWKVFVPPTLIGTNLRTKLRRKRDI